MFTPHLGTASSYPRFNFTLHLRKEVINSAPYANTGQRGDQSARNDKNRYLEQTVIEMENERDKSSKKVFQMTR